MYDTLNRILFLIFRFKLKNADAIELCLSHSSASEEKLIETPIRNTESMSESVETTQSTSDKEEGNAILHEMNFENSIFDETSSSSSSSPKKNMFVRELPITRADSPFGSDTAPEDDTTGITLFKLFTQSSYCNTLFP